MELYLNLVIWSLMLLCYICIYFVIRDGVRYDLMREHEKRKDREKNGQSVKSSGKENNILLDFERLILRCPQSLEQLR